MDVGDLVDGKYELLRRIGEGGMGTVFEARHLLLNKRVALKFLLGELARDEASYTRLVREAQAAAAIGSDHIVEVTDVGETPEGVPFLVMEYLDGPDLRQIIGRAKGAMPVERAVPLILQVCDGLSAAHQQGIVHRDLKPENIIVVSLSDGAERVKLLDFGIAKFQDLRLTATGAIIGTPQYMPPEQAQGSHDVDHRADIYSVGAILYEMVTGRAPYLGTAPSHVLVQVVTTPPPRPRELRPELSAQLEVVILHAMARDRAARFGSVAELGDALRPFASGDLSGQPGAEQTRPPIPSTKPVHPVHPRVLAAVADASPAAGGTKPFGDLGRPRALAQTTSEVGVEATRATRSSAEVVRGVPPTTIASGNGLGRRNQPASVHPITALRRKRLLLPLIVGSCAVLLIVPTICVLVLHQACSGSGRPDGFVEVSSGSFTLGLVTEQDPYAPPYARAVVSVSHDFWLGSTEVTQQQFARLMGSNPSSFTAGWPNAPVENVTWQLAAAYTNALSRREGLEECFSCVGSMGATTCVPSSRYASPYACNGYRLPTEVEWELAARGGAEQAQHVGTSSSSSGSCTVDSILSPIAWYCANSGQTTRAVRSLRPHALGLYDMLGNVHEWCFDWYSQLNALPSTDPFGPAIGEFKVVRGGSFSDVPRDVQIAIRHYSRPDQPMNSIGFRVARSQH